MSCFTARSTRNETAANSTVKILDGTRHFPSRVVVAARWINTQIIRTAETPRTICPPETLYFCAPRLKWLASSSKGRSAKPWPAVNSSAPRDLWEQKGFNMYAPTFEEIPLACFRRLTSVPGEYVCRNTPARPLCASVMWSHFFYGHLWRFSEQRVITSPFGWLECRRETFANMSQMIPNELGLKTEVTCWQPLTANMVHQARKTCWWLVTGRTVYHFRCVSVWCVKPLASRYARIGASCHNQSGMKRNNVIRRKKPSLPFLCCSSNIKKCHPVLRLLLMHHPRWSF